ncbi:MAG: dihydrolipoyl dehydrogenase [Syntrophaceae bacterium]|nr:dihydrolipoyl dehydrogenase [Syntrophaceae bacterium]
MEKEVKKFDAIIIGSGPGGYLAAILVTQKGQSAAIIEKGDFGGTCLNRGCIPTKALLREANLLNEMIKSGVRNNKEEIHIFFKKAMEKKDMAVQQVVGGLRNLLNRDRMTVFQGEASFTDPHTLRVLRDGTTLDTIRSNQIIIATGAMLKEESQFRRDGQKVLGSDDLLKMTELPTSMAVVGGGRRGVEFATFFNTFGVQVTLIEKQNRILPKMDREISVRYKSLLAKSNIKVLTDTEAIGMEISSDQKTVRLQVISKHKSEVIHCEKILWVGDRQGYVSGLNLEKASLTLKDGFIPVNLHMKTTSPGIYAVGDVVGRDCLAHKAFMEARIAVENMLGQTTQIDDRLIPICLYSNPEAASIGLSEEEAKKEWGEVNIGKFPFMACGQSIATQNQEGMVKIISEKKYGEILGVHLLGPRASDLIHLGAMAMRHEIGIEGIKEMIFAHPTFSEAFFEAALDTSDEAIHMMKG